MKIIKKNASGDSVSSKKVSIEQIIPEEKSGVLSKGVIEAKDRGQKILDAAHAEAEKMKNEALALKAKITAEMEAARRKGFEQGKSEGLEAVTEMATSLTLTREKFYADAEPEIIKLVMTIAEKVIGKLVRENEETIRSIVRQALESAIGERITVRLNPEDYAVVAADEMEFRDILDRTKRISFKEDETVGKGGCIVETEVGTIDAQLETQLKAIKKALQI